MYTNVKPKTAWHRDLAIVLRRYGFWGLDPDQGTGPTVPNLRVINATWDDVEPERNTFSAVHAEQTDVLSLPGVDCHEEAPGKKLFAATNRRWFGRRKVIYRPLLRHVCFSGPSVKPIWINSCGRSVIAWCEQGNRQLLLVGLQVAEEIIRYTQGDPAQVELAKDKTMWGSNDHERPAYLFENNVSPGLEMIP